MNPLDFLQVAIKFKDSKEEAERRTSVSRAYFAVYNHVKAFFKSNQVRVSDGSGGHGEVVRYLNQARVTKDRDLGGRIESLRTDRNDADYKLEKERFNINTVDIIVSRAEEIIEDFKGVDKRVLISEVGEYIKKIQP